jgi:cytochrome bd-type quinol oxidase subunit 2
MKYLLPHRFKKIGAIIAPVGFALWICMQFGYVTQILTFLFGESSGSQSTAYYHIANICIAIISFFSFLAGIYFVTFSKEKVEDEMVQRTRLDSFQFAALAQIIFIITGFLFMLFFEEPVEGGLMLFFITIIFLFWACFICRFNYIMHIKILRLSKA